MFLKAAAVALSLFLWFSISADCPLLFWDRCNIWSPPFPFYISPTQNSPCIVCTIHCHNTKHHLPKQQNALKPKLLSHKIFSF